MGRGSSTLQPLNRGASPPPPLSLSHTQKMTIITVILFASFHSPALVFEQLSLIYSLPRYLVRSFGLILPFFPTATMERIDKEGQVHTRTHTHTHTIVCIVASCTVSSSVEIYPYQRWFFENIPYSGKLLQGANFCGFRG